MMILSEGRAGEGWEGNFKERNFISDISGALGRRIHSGFCSYFKVFVLLCCRDLLLLIENYKLLQLKMLGLRKKIMHLFSLSGSCVTPCSFVSGSFTNYKLNIPRNPLQPSVHYMYCQFNIQ